MIPGSSTIVPSRADQSIAAECAGFAAGRAVGRMRAASLGDQRHGERPQEFEFAHRAVAAAMSARAARAAANGETCGRGPEIAVRGFPDR